MSLVILLAGTAMACTLRPTNLRCDARTDPVGIAAVSPSLSWELAPARKGLRSLAQTAYEVLVASSPGLLNANKGDVWSSGKVVSPDTFGLRVAGRLPESGSNVWWKVRVWDREGAVSDWSAHGTWSVGLGAADWSAQWIGWDAPAERLSYATWDGAAWIWHAADSDPIPASDRVFEKSFSLPAGVGKAVLRVSADDQFEVFVNGTQAAQSDGQTDAWRRPVEREVSTSLRAGENTLRVIAHNVKQGPAGVLVKLVATARDGAQTTVVSDGSWSSAERPGVKQAPVRVVGAYGVEPWGQAVGTNLVLPPPRYLRHGFDVGKKVRRAMLYGTARGLVEFHVNGNRVGDEWFVPGWSDYEKRIHVFAWEVTPLLREGKNALGAVLGDGWYAGYVGFGHKREHYGAQIRALAQMEIEFEDGTRQTVSTSKQWRAATGPILESDFLMGESYDARLEQAGWDQPGFNDLAWTAVDTDPLDAALLEAFPGTPVRTNKLFTPKRVKDTTPGVYVLDLGQNTAGVVRLRVKGEPGRRIVLRFAERLQPDGTVYTTNLRGARAIDTYVCKGTGVEEWAPRFTFHGFQYVEVQGLPARPKKGDIVALSISSETPDAGSLQTSDPMLNQLVSNAWWTQKMNFIDVPTDCPQRDERLGWTGDAQAYIRTACMTSDVQAFFTKWLVALDDAQRADGQYPMVAPLKVAGGDGGPAWADAGVICPWTVYDVYGDRDLLARHYPQMRRFVEFTLARSTPDLLPPKEFHCFGDWVNIGSPTPNDVIFEAYFAYSTELLAKAAAVLGNTEDHARYSALHERIKAAFNMAFVSEDGVVKGDSQCAYVLALGFHLLDPEMRAKAATRLVADIEKRGGHLSTGFVGTRDLMRVLSEIGRNDVAFKLLHNTTFPSWGFTIANGATSIWERWDGWTPEKGFQDPGMNSFAHYAFGAVVGWMYDQVGGIGNLTPGFGRVSIAPQMDPNLTWVRASYNSVRGPIACDWRLEGKKLTMRVVVPPNTTAVVKVPATGVTASAGAVARGDGVFEVGSGEYRFEGSL